MRPRSAFTLIEMLIVVSILTILGSMLMTIISTARRTASKTATQAVMHKVDTALRQFKTDFKAYPFQRHYPDLSAGETWSNKLYYQVGTDISDDNRRNVIADMDTAGAKYNYDLTNGEPNSSPHMFRYDRQNGKTRNDEWGRPDGDEAPYSSYYRNSTATWYFWYENPWAVYAAIAVLNRMGAERARLLMLIGDVDACGVKMVDIPGTGAGNTNIHKGRDLSAIPIVPTNQRQSDPDASGNKDAKPGWAVDYLQGELEKRYIDGDTVLDAYRRPLVYICQVIPGVRSSIAKPFGQSVGIWAPQWYGLTRIGRKTLSHDAAADADGGLPDPGNLMHSDITKYAAPGYELEFELWSAGPDGKFTYMRDERENRDNIPCDAYLQDLR